MDKNPTKEAILIIDDEQDLADLIKTVFQAAGFEASTADSAEVAFALLEQRRSFDPPYHLILLDLNLPGVSGTEIYHRLQADPTLADIPVIVFSAVDNIDRRVELLAMGADDYLVKPVQIDELLARVSIHIKLRRLHREKQQAEARSASLFRDLQQRNDELNKLNAENTRLLRIERLQRNQAEKLYTMAHVISSSLNSEEVLATAMGSIRNLFQVEAGSVILYDPATNKLRFAQSLQHSPTLQQLEIPFGKGIVSQVISSRKPLIINNAQKHPLFFADVDYFTGDQTQSILCVPLITRDNVIGAIELINKEQGVFNEIDQTLLSTVASSLAVAIDNASLYQHQVNLIEKLNQSQEQLVQSEKLAATGRLSAALAHEINNPLQAIHSILQLLLEFHLTPDKQVEYLEMAAEEVERLMDTGVRILEFSRPSSGNFELININRVVGQVMDLTHKYTVHHEYQIYQNLASDLPRVRVIVDQIAQVFLCIILNAFDAMDESGVLTIKTQMRKNWVEIHFVDTGIGISEVDRARIFEPFYTTKEGASGLGLAISYGIVDRHHGTISVTSEVGKGSTFIIRLPRARS